MPGAGYAAATLRALLVILSLGTVAEPARADCDPAAHGVVPGMVDSTSFQNLLQACAGEAVNFAAGTYTFVTSSANPQGFFVWGGTPQSPTVLRGSGNATAQADPTVFKVVSAGGYPFQALLFIMNNAEVGDAPDQVVNASNITVENIVFEGSSAPAGCPQWDYGNAIWIQSNNIPGAASIENINIIRNVISNFSGMNWLALIATDGSPGIGRQSEIAIAANIFDASSPNPGSCVNNSSNTTPVFQVLISGSSYLPTGLVSNVAHPITNNDLQANRVGISVADGDVAIAQNYIGVPPNGYGMKISASEGGLFDIQGVYLSAAAANSVSVIGAGKPDDPSSLSVNQNGWKTCGGKNPALRWYSDYPGGHAVTSYAAIPNVDFGTITANGQPQTAFWLPTCN